MSKQFSAMQTNVGRNVQDTSSAFATLIGNWLNDKYRDISRRCLWSALIDMNYTFESSATEISLPSDFEQEIFVADIQEGRRLDRYPEGKWWEERYNQYSADAIPAGTPYRYIILEEADKIHLDPPPDATHTYAMPYKKLITDLVNSTDTTVIKDIEFAMEVGATGEAWAYKRQFQKADYYNTRYEIEVTKRIGQERKKINQLYQFISETYRLPDIRPLVGWNSYDTI